MGINLIASRRRIVMAQPHLVTPTPANPVAFSATLAAPLKSLECAFSPVQAGSGDPSPENVRPISGWTNCNVVRCGKNLFDAGADMPLVDCYNYQATAQRRRAVEV